MSYLPDPNGNPLRGMAFAILIAVPFWAIVIFLWWRFSDGSE